MTENKVSKYLLYAFGEIVLVVIGILVALYINNMNDLRKERVRELGPFFGRKGKRLGSDFLPAHVEELSASKPNQPARAP